MTDKYKGLLTAQEYANRTSGTPVYNVHKLLTRIKCNPFSLGDFLICRDKLKNKLVGMSASSEVPTRFVVVCIDDVGLTYCKKLCLNGALSKVLYCITLADHDRFEYSLDPEYEEHLLFNGNRKGFDPFSNVKRANRHKKAILDKNKKIRINTNSKASINRWLSNLKSEDRFWKQPPYGKQPSSDQFIIKKIKKVPDSSDYKLLITRTNYSHFYEEDIFTEYFLGKVIYRSRPYDYQDR